MTVTCTKCSADNVDAAKFCNLCGTPVGQLGLAVSMQDEVAFLRKEIAELIEIVDFNAEELNEATAVLQSSNVFSTDFLTRASAIWGHALVVGGAFTVVLVMLALIISKVQ